PVTFSRSIYPSRAILYLHSFPTRRSSDLVPTGSHGRCGARRSHGAALPDRAHPHSHRAVSDAALLPARAPRRRLADGRSRNREQDRKSTRLNSSHVSISYAVFCLKKKTTT